MAGHLKANGELARPLYLFGVSMGAATAIHSAADEPAWAAVVAIAPYRTAAEGIASGVAGLLAGSAGTLRMRTARTLGRSRYDAARIEQAVARAGERIGLDLRNVDVGARLAHIPACALHLQGRIDTLIEVEATLELARSSPRAVYVELPDDGHFSIQARTSWLAVPIAQWLYGATDLAIRSSCPDFELPSDPAAAALSTPSRNG